MGKPSNDQTWISLPISSFEPQRQSLEIPCAISYDLHLLADQCHSLSVVVMACTLQDGLLFSFTRSDVVMVENPNDSGSQLRLLTSET